MKLFKLGINISLSYIFFSILISIMLSGAIEDLPFILSSIFISVLALKNYLGLKLKINKKLVKKDIFIFYILNYGVQGILLVFVGAANLFFNENLLSFDSISSEGLALMIMNSVLLAPILEELYFRKYIMDTFEKRGEKYVKYGIIINSMLFGLAHLSMVSFGAFMSGISYSLIYRKTNNIILPILLHSMRNLGVILLRVEGSYIKLLGLSIYVLLPFFLFIYFKEKKEYLCMGN